MMSLPKLKQWSLLVMFSQVFSGSHLLPRLLFMLTCLEGDADFFNTGSSVPSSSSCELKKLNPVSLPSSLSDKKSPSVLLPKALTIESAWKCQQKNTVKLTMKRVSKQQKILLIAPSLRFRRTKSDKNSHQLITGIAVRQISTPFSILFATEGGLSSGTKVEGARIGISALCSHFGRFDQIIYRVEHLVVHACDVGFERPQQHWSCEVSHLTCSGLVCRKVFHGYCFLSQDHINLP